LLQYGVLLVICFILELAGLAYILDNGTLWSKMTWWLRDKFYELIYKSDENPKMARILRIIQEEVSNFDFYLWRRAFTIRAISSRIFVFQWLICIFIFSFDVATTTIRVPQHATD
jgi:hypothetical protein